MGVMGGIDPGTSGTAFFDAFESRRQSYIGPAGVQLAEAGEAMGEGVMGDPAEVNAYTDTDESDPAEVQLMQDLLEQEQTQGGHDLYLPAITR
jgi:hypothetical protein